MGFSSRDTLPSTDASLVHLVWQHGTMKFNLSIASQTGHEIGFGMEKFSVKLIVRGLKSCDSLTKLDLGPIHKQKNVTLKYTF